MHGIRLLINVFKCYTVIVHMFLEYNCSSSSSSVMRTFAQDGQSTHSKCPYFPRVLVVVV